VRVEFVASKDTCFQVGMSADLRAFFRKLMASHPLPVWPFPFNGQIGLNTECLLFCCYFLYPQHEHGGSQPRFFNMAGVLGPPCHVENKTVFVIC
jgi:hypothetical protein